MVHSDSNTLRKKVFLLGLVSKLTDPVIFVFSAALTLAPPGQAVTHQNQVLDYSTAFKHKRKADPQTEPLSG